MIAFSQIWLGNTRYTDINTVMPKYFMTTVKAFLFHLSIIHNKHCVRFQNVSTSLTMMLLLRLPTLLYFEVTEIVIVRISFKESALLGSLQALCWLLHNLESRPFSVFWHLLLLVLGAFLSCLILVCSFKTSVGQEKKFSSNISFVWKITACIYTENGKVFHRYDLMGFSKDILIKIPFLAKGMEGKLKSGPGSWCWLFSATQHLMTPVAFGEPSNIIRQVGMSPASVSAVT